MQFKSLLNCIQNHLNTLQIQRFRNKVLKNLSNRASLVTTLKANNHYKTKLKMSLFNKINLYKFLKYNQLKEIKNKLIMMSKILSKRA